MMSVGSEHLSKINSWPKSVKFDFFTRSASTAESSDSNVMKAAVGTVKLSKS